MPFCPHCGQNHAQTGGAPAARGLSYTEQIRKASTGAMVFKAAPMTFNAAALRAPAQTVASAIQPQGPVAGLRRLNLQPGAYESDTIVKPNSFADIWFFTQAAQVIPQTFTLDTPGLFFESIHFRQSAGPLIEVGAYKSSANNPGAMGSLAGRPVQLNMPATNPYFGKWSDPAKDGHWSRGGGFIVRVGNPTNAPLRPTAHITY